MRRNLAALGLAIAVLTWSAPGAAAQAWDCRWVGEGEALLCVHPPTGLATLATWQGSAWVTVPAAAGFSLPAVAGGLSTYGQSYPPSPVTPALGYYSQTWLGNTLSQTRVLYGPGATSHAVNCTAWYSGYAGGIVYQTCR
jgi:hypothetical protein